ncbi:hypothetical protein QC762_0114400 [Podospora pseudocomata]|uniref:Uncharacterized protein n=1 Tax=Podospora pseudocomata TaxID=2093779 RepID=A0ABR0G587_9PEZI|nr:hypothetical protein QC762_0114400 [Podospora pseudocomata]
MRTDLELARGSGGAVVRSAVGGCRDVLTWRSSPRLEIIWAELDVTCRGLESPKPGLYVYGMQPFSREAMRPSN